jgi:hypothetical protein
VSKPPADRETKREFRIKNWARILKMRLLDKSGVMIKKINVYKMSCRKRSSLRWAGMFKDIGLPQLVNPVRFGPAIITT